jgi:hypothetical protein
VSQIGEAVKVSGLDEKVLKCPFKAPPPPKDPSPEDEDHPWDDRISMATAQANSGGKLGGNVEDGSPGKDGTWNVLGGDPPRYEAIQVDTTRAAERGDTSMVKIRGRNYPYTVAAHHLIPGNASLYESQLFKSYMRRGGKMEADTPDGTLTFEVSHNIGYNVNGSHNGVWLPGSYAIEAGGSHPGGVAWSVLNSPAGNIGWCYDYMAAVAKKAKGQFHDTHKFYNENALEVLEKQTVRLMNHQVKCRDCRGAKKVPPPYEIKAKLYRLSEYFRTQTLAPPSGWKLPWVTSDQVHTDIMSVPPKKRQFLKAYRESAT